MKKQYRYSDNIIVNIVSVFDVMEHIVEDMKNNYDSHKSDNKILQTKEIDFSNAYYEAYKRTKIA